MAEGAEERPGITRWADVGVRAVIVIGLLTWSFLLVRPFIPVVMWAAVLSVSVMPVYTQLAQRLGDRRKTAAGLVVLAILALLVIPGIVLTNSLFQGARRLAADYDAGALNVPPPPEQVQALPVIGPQVADTWRLASTDFMAATTFVRPQLDAARDFLIDSVADAASAALLFLFSLIVMGVFLATSRDLSSGIHRLGARIGGERGEAYVDLARDTIRSVTKGILGVAVIQAVMGGLGCLVAGVPGAGFWALLILVFCIAQVGPAIVLVPIIIYVFNREPTWVFVLFTIWSTITIFIDNVLKPLLLGRGVKAPMLVVFIGAIGGLLLSGLIGLFLGPVVLVVTYNVVRSWFEMHLPPPDGSPEEGAA